MHRRSAGAPPPLPVRELVGMLSDRFQRQTVLVHHHLIVASLLAEQRVEVDGEGIDLRLTGKVEYLGRHYNFRGFQSITFLDNWQ